MSKPSIQDVDELWQRNREVYLSSFDGLGALGAALIRETDCTEEEAIQAVVDWLDWTTV